VTGSCHLVTLDDRRILIDCGFFQGPKELEKRNREPFPFEAGNLDAVLVTHGHLDHVGRLPKLVREGYRGPIYATRATREIAEIILRDAAHLQREDYQRALRKARRAGRESLIAPPLFDEEDVRATLALFREPVEFATPLALGRTLHVTFQPAGHVLGSAWIELATPHLRVTASGDLGNRESALQAPATLPRECDVVLIETTYANRNHRSREATREEFRQVVTAAVARGGNVLIPSFALERTQQVLYQLRQLLELGEVPRVAVYLDSPMATKFTKLYQTCKNEFRPEVEKLLEEGDDPFEPETLSYTVSTEASKALNEVKGGAIIVAGSGMMTGGRIRHHLKHNLWRQEASLVVVGYQASGTLGRALVDGAKRVRIFGETIAVRARIHTIGGFSAHADQDDLLRWLKASGNAKVLLVHGEEAVMEGFQGLLEGLGRRVILPRPDTPVAF